MYLHTCTIPLFQSLFQPNQFHEKAIVFLIFLCYDVTCTATSQCKLSRGCTHAWPFWITKSSKQFDGSYLQTNIMKHSLSVKAILWKRWRWNIDKDLMLSVLNQRDLRNADSKKCRCSLRVHHVNIVQTFENVNS